MCKYAAIASLSSGERGNVGIKEKYYQLSLVFAVSALEFSVPDTLEFIVPLRIERGEVSGRILASNRVVLSYLHRFTFQSD